MTNRDAKSHDVRWFYLTGHDVRADILLVHELRRQEPVRLARFAGLRRCPECEKFDEEQILAVGFDPDRRLPLPRDIVTGTLDLPWTLVSERFRDTCTAHEIGGVRFIPCGRNKAGEPLHALWPEHASLCRAPLEDWLRGVPRKPTDPAEERCSACGRFVHVVGFPPPSALEFPDERTISVPSLSTEMRTGRDFRFFCSETVRQILKAAQLRGLSFNDMDSLAKRFYGPSGNTA